MAFTFMLSLWRHQPIQLGHCKLDQSEGKLWNVKIFGLSEAKLKKNKIAEIMTKHYWDDSKTKMESFERNLKIKRDYKLKIITKIWFSFLLSYLKLTAKASSQHKTLILCGILFYKQHLSLDKRYLRLACFDSIKSLFASEYLLWLLDVVIYCSWNMFYKVKVWSFSFLVLPIFTLSKMCA